MVMRKEENFILLIKEEECILVRAQLLPLFARSHRTQHGDLMEELEEECIFIRAQLLPRVARSHRTQHISMDLEEVCIFIRAQLLSRVARSHRTMRDLKAEAYLLLLARLLCMDAAFPPQVRST